MTRRRRLFALLLLTLAALPVAAARHPDFALYDSQGKALSASDSERYSELTSCGECHDSNHIRQSLSPAHRRLPAHTLLGDTLKTKLGQTVTQSPDTAIACTSCHGGPLTISDEGQALGASITSGGHSQSCAGCHGEINLQTTPPFLPGQAQGADLGLLTGSLLSGQRVNSSAINVTDKAQRKEPFDVHLARGIQCTDCHRAVNRPGDRFRNPQTSPAGLHRDPRKVGNSDYLHRPDHDLGVTLQCTDCHSANRGHEWLPFREQHQSRLACESCHIPNPLGPALRHVASDTAPLVRGRDEQGLISGFSPLLLPRDGQLAPYNLFSVATQTDDPASLLVIPVAHGVVRDAALRECSVCHLPGGRTQGMLELGPVTDLTSASPQPLSAHDSLRLEIVDGSWNANAVPEAQGFYVLGTDQVAWADRLGMLITLGTLGGVLAHGAARYVAYRRRGEHIEARERVYMYSVYERFWHWLQAVAILGLLITGAAIHKPYLFPFLHFAYMVELHNLLGWILLGNAVLAAFYHVATGEVKQYLPGTHDLFGRMFVQARYYVQGIFRGDPHPFAKDPEHKLNPLQQLTYFGLLNTLLPAQILTGTLIWGAQRWPGLTESIGGLMVLAPLHGFMAWLFAAFLIMHIYLTTTSGPRPLSGIKAMLEGWEDVEKTSGGS